MPRISYFYGISIRMFYDDHVTPHFHAAYAEFEASFDIVSGRTLGGRLPRRAMRLVGEWASLRKQELLEDWQLAEQGLPLRAIDPLD